MTNQMLLDVCVDTDVSPQVLHFISDTPNRLRGKSLFTSFLDNKKLWQFGH